MNNNLPFVIPSSQSTKDKKGGGKGYTYYGDPTTFTAHKQGRIAEVQQIAREVKSEKPKITNPEQLSFLDIQLNPKATAKSSIPVELFDDYGLDVNKRIEANELIVSGTLDALGKFEDALKDFEYVPQLNDPGNFKNKEAALLSAISKISKVPKDKKLAGKIEESNHGVAYFYKSISELSAKKIASDLVKDRHISAEYKVSPSGAKILAGEFSAKDVELIINSDFENPFSKFEVMHRIGVVTKSINTTYPITNAKVDASNANVVIGIVDGGIAELGALDGLVVGHKDYSTNPDSDKSHGTLAASRAIVGNDIEDQLFDTDSLVARAKVVDIKVMDGDIGPMPDELIGYLEDAIMTFPEVKIFSMSIGLNDFCQRNKKSYLSRELDALQHKYGVVFVVAAGNRDDFHLRQYPDVLLELESRINSPADIINGLSVGSLADKANKDSLAQINEPSPFTRTGFDGIRKPDIVHYGGNARKTGVWRDQGVKGFDVNENELNENIGTSFAAPVASGELAEAMNHIDKSEDANAVDLTKALVVHSANYIPNETSLINPLDLDKIVGHGIPNVENVLFSDDTKAVFVITDTIGGIRPRSKTRNAVRKIQFTIPDELKKLKRDLNVRATLAYTSPVDADDEVDTALSDVTMTLYKVNSRKNLVNSGKADDSDYSYKPKWYTIKCLERTYSARSYDSGEWEIRLTLQTRGDADADDYFQSVALVVSIEDVGDDDGRINIQELIKNNHKQYVRINEIKSRQKLATS